MILVVGATGLVGSEVCLRLAERGEAVRALVRTTSAPEKLTRLRSAGVDLCFGDLKDPASLAACCKGVEAIISTASSTFSRQEGDSIATVDDTGQLNLVDAARAAGIGRFLFVSFRRPEHVSFPLGDAKSHVEQAIADLNFTVLQASFFMEAWLSPALGFDYIQRTARVYGAGTNPLSWVSFRDVAAMCVVALRHPGASRRIIAFGGPDALSPLEVVARFEAVGAEPFTVEHIPEATLQAQFASATDPMQKSFAALMLGFAGGDAMDMQSIQREFGLELRRVDDYAREVLTSA